MNNLEPPQTPANARCTLPIWEPIAELYIDRAAPLLIGFDTEYERIPNTNRNRMVSYQYFALNTHTGGEWRGIWKSEGKRCRLPALLAHVIMDGLSRQHLRVWPCELYLIGHFTIADLPAFTDFRWLRRRFDSVRRTFVSTNRPAVLSLWDKSRNEHQVNLLLRDSKLLAPAAKQSLAELGNLLGLPKIELPDGSIERMAHLSESDPDLFLEYALRDPEICVRWGLRLMLLNLGVNGKATIPPTLASIGVAALLRGWELSGVDKHAVLGTVKVEEREWNDGSKQYRRTRRRALTEDRHLYESFAVECYHGGRNEQYFFGAGEVGDWYDYDLIGAYTTAMALISLHPTAAPFTLVHAEK